MSENSIQSVIMVVTPAMAAEWLKNNKSNRSVSHVAVKKYAADMINGSWKLNGEAIKIGPSGEILDGQHRCLAGVESGVAFQSVVIFNVPVDHQQTMDSGRSRSLNDQLKMRGESNYTSLGASIRLAVNYHSGSRTFNSPNNLSNTQLLHWLEYNPAIRRSASVGQSVAQSKVGIGSGLAGSLHFVFSGIDVNDADEFFRLVREASHEEGSPILALRETIRKQRDKSKGSPLSSRWVAGIVIKAWNRWRSGEKSALWIRFSPGGAAPEKFPEPI